MDDEIPRLVGEDQRDDHAGNDHQDYLDDPVAQLAQVVHQGHPPVRVAPPLRAQVTLAHDAGTPDGGRLRCHDRVFPEGVCGGLGGGRA